MGQSISPPDLAKVISDHERFVLLSHTRPDGDAIGSEVALKSVLEAMGKSVRALNEDGTPEHLEFCFRRADIDGSGTLDINECPSTNAHHERCRNGKTADHHDTEYWSDSAYSVNTN